HAAPSRSGVERPRPGTDGGTAAAARSRGHLVVRLRRPQRHARAGTRRVTTDVVVTGIGVVSALGVGVEAFWDALVSGRSGCAPGGDTSMPDVPLARVEGLE